MMNMDTTSAADPQFLDHRPRVMYVALGGKRKPSPLMQPKVREVYRVLHAYGPLVLSELRAALGDGFDRNTLRFAIQVLRQAGLVKSEPIPKDTPGERLSQ